MQPTVGLRLPMSAAASCHFPGHALRAHAASVPAWLIAMPIWQFVPRGKQRSAAVALMFGAAFQPDCRWQDVSLRVGVQAAW